MTDAMEPDMDQVVLVTGGSGFLGQHVVRELQLHDPRVREIRVLDLNPYVNLLGHEESKPVRSFIGDITEPEACRAAFSGATCVIHAAAFVSYAFPPDLHKLNAVNVQGTSNVVQLCREEHVGQLVYIGTAEVAMRPRFMNRLYPLIVGQNEARAKPVTTDCSIPEYVLTKLRAERVVLKADNTYFTQDEASDKPTGRLRTTVLRPTNMYGELDPRTLPAALWAASWMCNLLVSPTGYGGRQQLTYAGNVAWAAVLAKDALRNAKRVEMVAGAPIFITDDTMVDHAFVLAEKIAGKRAKVCSAWFPIILTYPAAVLLETMASTLNLTLPVQPTAVLSYLGGVVAFSRLRAGIHLQYSPRYTEDDAVKRTQESLDSCKNSEHEE